MYEILARVFSRGSVLTGAGIAFGITLAYWSMVIYQAFAEIEASRPEIEINPSLVMAAIVHLMEDLQFWIITGVSYIVILTILMLVNLMLEILADLIRGK